MTCSLPIWNSTDSETAKQWLDHNEERAAWSGQHQSQRPGEDCDKFGTNPWQAQCLISTHCYVSIQIQFISEYQDYLSLSMSSSDREHSQGISENVFCRILYVCQDLPLTQRNAWRVKGVGLEEPSITFDRSANEPLSKQIKLMTPNQTTIQEHLSRST